MVLSIDFQGKKGLLSLSQYSVTFDLINDNRQQQILINIERLMKQKNITPKDITKIRVNTKAGSYTSLRVGITIANILSGSWGIPVESFSGMQADFVLPYYNAPAKITPKRSSDVVTSN